MITISRITVTNSFSVRYLDISWEIANTTEDISPYVFEVYRSLSPDSDFNPVSPQTAGYSFRDNTVNLLDTAIMYYYKIKSTNTSTAASNLSTEVGYMKPGHTDYYAQTIMFQEQYILRYVINSDDPGRKVKLIVRRRFGQHCPVCWDHIKKSVGRSNCTTCYGSGFTGGYLAPEDLFISITSGTVQLSTNINDIREKEAMITGWMDNFPVVAPDDILIDAVNKRYRIVNVQRTTKAQFVLRQQFTAQVLPPTDIIYKVPV